MTSTYKICDYETKLSKNQQEENSSEGNESLQDQEPDRSSTTKRQYKKNYQLSKQTSLPDTDSQINSIECVSSTNEFKTPVHPDDSGYSMNWQVDNASQQCDISMDQNQQIALIDLHQVMVDQRKIQDQATNAADIKIKRKKQQKTLKKQNKNKPQVSKPILCPYQVKIPKKPQNLVTNLEPVKVEHIKQKAYELMSNQVVPPMVNQIKLRKKNDPKSQVQAKQWRQNKDHTLAYKSEHTTSLDQITNVLFNHRMQNELENFAFHIRSQHEKYNQAREIVFRRIQSIVHVLFQYSDAGMFGSCATGLALPDSDIDITISGFEMFPKAQLFQPMQHLLQILSQYNWVVKYKHIYTASIPILKLEIDPSVAFNSYTHQPIYIYQTQSLNFDATKIPSRSFQVDIIFDSKTPENQYNLAYWSTDMIIQWTRTYPGFSEITMILKYLLKQKNLNEAFSGGISSYCLSIMLAAVYQGNHVKYQDQYSMLQQFLFKYGTDFDLKTSAVCLSDRSGFILQDDAPAYQLAVYSPITNQVISSSAVSAPEIMKEFRNFYSALMILKKKLLVQIQRFIPPEILHDMIQERWHVKDILKHLPVDQEFLQLYLNQQ